MAPAEDSTARLPEALIAEIIERVGPCHELGCCFLVCKKWSSVCNRMSKLTIRPYSYARRYAGEGEVYINCIQYRIFAAVNTNAGALEQLIIKLPMATIEQAAFLSSLTTSLHACQNLKYFKLTVNFHSTSSNTSLRGCESLLKSLGNSRCLEQLIIRDFANLPPDLSSFLQQWPNLRKLKLSAVPFSRVASTSLQLLIFDGARLIVEAPALFRLECGSGVKRLELKSTVPQTLILKPDIDELCKRISSTPSEDRFVKNLSVVSWSSMSLHGDLKQLLDQDIFKQLKVLVLGKHFWPLKPSVVLPLTIKKLILQASDDCLSGKHVKWLTKEIEEDSRRNIVLGVENSQYCLQFINKPMRLQTLTSVEIRLDPWPTSCLL